MQCRYCRSSNPEGAHRCSRCGRPLAAASSSRSSPALNPAAPLVAPPERPQRGKSPKQRSLFEEEKPGATVIPFESIGGGSKGPERKKRSDPANRSSARTEAARRVSRKNAGQQSLDLLSAAPQPSRRRTTAVGSTIYCNAPVAPVEQRVKAAALDAAVVAIATVFFLAIVYMVSGEIVLGGPGLAAYAACFLVILLFYKWLAAVGGESPGVRWAGLRLLNFDGRPPDKRQRLVRLLSCCLSVLPFGLGMLWALVDEEHLTWHDHMSKTFPTPRD